MTKSCGALRIATRRAARDCVDNCDSGKRTFFQKPVIIRGNIYADFTVRHQRSYI
jgi:hypothetical protein